MREFDRIFREKKAGRELVLRKDIRDTFYGSNVNSCMLDKTEEVEYSSNIFSKLKYEFKAHKESVVPVTEEDFTSKEKI